MSAPAPRLPLPRFVQVGRAETLSLPLYYQGQASAVASGTYSLFDADGAEVIAATAVTVTNGVASYALPSTFADAYAVPQDPWRERWDLAGVANSPSDELRVEQEVHVCRVAPTPHVTVEDLYRIHAPWRAQIPQVYPGGAVDQPIEVAWEELLSRLLGDGHLPHRRLNWWAVSVVHKYWAAHLVCRDFMTDQAGDSRWERLADAYWKRVEDEYAHRLASQADGNEDGVADAPGMLEVGEPQLFLTALPSGWCP